MDLSQLSQFSNHYRLPSSNCIADNLALWHHPSNSNGLSVSTISERQYFQISPTVTDYKGHHSVTGCRRLRSSSDIDMCVAQWTKTHLGDRSFAAAEPRVWNSLPTQLR